MSLVGKIVPGPPEAEDLQVLVQIFKELAKSITNKERLLKEKAAELNDLRKIEEQCDYAIE